MFSEQTLKTVEAIVSVHENGRPHGKYDSVAVLPDGPHNVRQVTYGSHQATDASNTLDKIIARYCELDEALVAGGTAASLKTYLPVLAQNTRQSFQKLAADRLFIDLLHKAGYDPLMIQAQTEIFRENYLKPAIAICEKRGFKEALSLAVVYDSLIHGAFNLVSTRVLELTGNEKLWIARYIVERRNWLKNHSKKILNNCVYRMDTFLNLLISEEFKPFLTANTVKSLQGKSAAEVLCEIVMKGLLTGPAFQIVAERGNWLLTLPVVAHGIAITEFDLA